MRQFKCVEQQQIQKWLHTCLLSWWRVWRKQAWMGVRGSSEQDETGNKQTKKKIADEAARLRDSQTEQSWSLEEVTWSTRDVLEGLGLPVSSELNSLFQPHILICRVRVKSLTQSLWASNWCAAGKAPSRSFSLKEILKYRFLPSPLLAKQNETKWNKSLHANLNIFKSIV